MSALVRPLRPEDHEAVAELTLASYVDGGHIAPDDAYVKTLMDVADRAGRAEVLVAEVDGEVAGSVVLTPPGSPLAETSGDAEADEWDRARRQLVRAVDYLEETVLRFGIVNRAAARRGYGEAGDPVSTSPQE